MTDIWQSAASGDWSDPSNWSLDRIPAAGNSVEIAPAAPLTVTFDVGALALAALVLDDATLTLNGGALTVDKSTGLTDATVNGAMPLNLYGAATISGGFTLGGSVALGNYGALTQSGGAVALGAEATIRNGAAGTWTIADASGITQTYGGAYWGFINAGAFVKTSTTGIALIAANFFSTGVISSASGGDIEFDGAHTYLSGTYIGPGMVDYGPDGVAQVANVDVTQASCQTNWGKVDLVGDMTMDDGSTIMNAQGAFWNFDGDYSLLLGAAQSAGPIIDGMGAIAKIAGTGVSDVGIDVDAEGAVTVATGTLDFEGASSVFSALVNGAGDFEIGGGAATFAPGARLTVANWTLGGGTAELGENLAYAGAFSGEAGATLALDDYTLALTSSATLAGLQVEGPGGFALRAGGNVSGLTVTDGAALRAFGAVTQSGGELTLGDSGASDGATLSIANGGSWALEGSSGIALGADRSNAVLIGAGGTAGVLYSEGTNVVAPTIVNDGFNIPAGHSYQREGVDAQAGSLDLQGAVFGTGTDNIEGGATLEFDRAVAAGQTVVFGGSGATLFVNDLAGFQAKIVDFEAGSDALLIGGGYTFAGASETAGAATLAFTRSGVTTDLTLTGSYEGHVFTPTQEGGGVLRIA